MKTFKEWIKDAAKGAAKAVGGAIGAINNKSAEYEQFAGPSGKVLVHYSELVKRLQNRGYSVTPSQPAQLDLDNPDKPYQLDLDNPN